MVTFANVVDHANPSIEPVLRRLRGRIRGLGRMGEKVTSKTRISYEVARDFCEVRVQRERILVRVFNTGMRDPKGVITDIPKSHGWQFEKEIPIDSEQLVDYATPFVEASYRSSRANIPRR